MADQQTQNTAIVEEKQVPPTDEVEEGPGSKVESPVPPVAKSSTLELTESPEVVAAMAVDLTTAKTEFEFRSVNRESLDQVSNSKVLFVLSLCSTL